MDHARDAYWTGRRCHRAFKFIDARRDAEELAGQMPRRRIATRTADARGIDLILVAFARSQRTAALRHAPPPGIDIRREPIADLARTTRAPPA